MRDAQSALDQVISFAGDKIRRKTSRWLWRSLTFSSASSTALQRTNPPKRSRQLTNIVMRGHDLRNFCRDLIAHFRDLLVTKVSQNEELLESAVCESQELCQAELFTESDLVRFFHSLAETETKLRAATQPRY